MVTKKKAPTRVKTRTVYKAAPRKRRTVKSGTQYIPSAAATVALVAVNADKIKNLANAVTNNGSAAVTQWPNRFINGSMASGTRVNNALKSMISTNALVTDGVAIAGGYLVGELARKYAPNVVKKPLGKIAKKIPKVI